jgi:molecular chaperone DnaK (HSP70)
VEIVSVDYQYRFSKADSIPATSQKIPTLLLYDGKRMKWGYEAEQSVHPGNQHQLIQGVKLLMDEGQEFRYAPASESGKLIKQMGKSAVQVSGDYLASLVTHAREMLRRRFGAALQTFDLHYILTVPALWSDKGKNSTMQAAHLAGIPAANLTLLSEPEAAAVYAIRTIQPNTIAVCIFSSTKSVGVYLSDSD